MGWFDWLRPDPRASIEKSIRTKSTRAMELQRAGKLRQAAVLHVEIEALEAQLSGLDRS